MTKKDNYCHDLYPQELEGKNANFVSTRSGRSECNYLNVLYMVSTIGEVDFWILDMSVKNPEF
jgi:hypothetical protein